jgi:hypothetical protein
MVKLAKRYLLVPIVKLCFESIQSDMGMGSSPHFRPKEHAEQEESINKNIHTQNGVVHKRFISEIQK